MSDPLLPPSLLKAAQGDPDGLTRLRAIKQIEDAVTDLTTEAVRLARRQDRSWQQVGGALGITRQSAHKRFGDGDGVNPPFE